jgi:hypothetical protein
MVCFEGITYDLNDPEQKRAYHRAYHRLWRQANRERLRAYFREWCKNNKEKVAIYQRDYQLKKNKQMPSWDNSDVVLNVG